MEFKVNTTVPIQFEKIDETEDQRFTKVKIYLCHTGKNLNNSSFSKEVIEDALPSLSNIPIVGFIEVDNYNESDFKGHEQRIVIDNDGVSVEYVGRAYGIIPENNNARFEMKDVNGIQKEFLVVDGLLWNKFKEAVDIFDRDEEKSQSMELDSTSIEGKFSKDGVYDFTKFRFEAACILGNDVLPAMSGSVIEKFSASTIQDQFKNMLEEFNLKYSQISEIVNEEIEDVDNELEGGNDEMDEKLELLNSFSQLSEDQVSEIKADLEKYSLDELNEKLTELTKVEEPKNDDMNFSLTASQLKKEIQTTLGKEKYATDWDYEARAYWYIDHDENRIYCEDAQDGFRAVGVNYNLEGDFVSVDFSSKKAVKFIPVDMEDGVDTNFSAISEERKEFELDKVKVDTEKEITDKFQTVKNELDSTKADLETLTDENKELKEFKLNTEKAKNEEKIETLFAKFEDLTEDDTKELREKSSEMSLEILELNLYALRGKKQDEIKDIKSKKEIKDNGLLYSLVEPTNNAQDSNKPEWADIVEQHNK